MEKPLPADTEKYSMQTPPPKSRRASNTSLPEKQHPRAEHVRRTSSVSMPADKQYETPARRGRRVYERNNNGTKSAPTRNNNDPWFPQTSDKPKSGFNGKSTSNGKDVALKAEGGKSVVTGDMETQQTGSVIRRERVSKCYKVSMLVTSRLLFSVHLLLTIWRLTVLFGDLFWIFAAGLVGFLIDIVFVLVIRQGKEWTWFQPVVLIYLLIELPCIWLLELHKVSTVQVQHNQTAILGTLYQSSGEDALSDLVDLDLSNESWALILEQSMLVFIIIARWLMPKGDLTRDQLSALLLTYIGIASDVVDLFSVLAEDSQLLLDLAFVMTILATWSWSMVQFIFITSMTHSEAKGEGEGEEEEDDDLVQFISQNSGKPNEEGGQQTQDSQAKKRHCSHGLRVAVESEIWSICMSLFMQDGPFVVVRLVCVFYWRIKTYTNYFFTAKNLLVLFLQVYRLVAVYHQHQRHKHQEREKKKRTMLKIFNFLSNSENRKRINSVSPIDLDVENLRRTKDIGLTSGVVDNTDSAVCLT